MITIKTGRAVTPTTLDYVVNIIRWRHLVNVDNLRRLRTHLYNSRVTLTFCSENHYQVRCSRIQGRTQRGGGAGGLAPPPMASEKNVF